MDWEQIKYDSSAFFMPHTLQKIIDTEIYVSKDKRLEINGWTIMHLISGIIIGFIYLHYLKYNNNFIWYFIVLLSLHIIWEYYETLISIEKPFEEIDDIYDDTIIDTIFFAIGYCSIYYLYFKYNLTNYQL